MTPDSPPQSPAALLCSGGNIARFTRPVLPTHHCGDPSCACMAKSASALPTLCPKCGGANPDAFHLHYHGVPAPSSLPIMPACPTHGVALERRTMMVEQTTVGNAVPAEFIACPLCFPFSNPSESSHA